MILAEFDYDKDAIINPSDIIKEEITEGVEVPKVAVACFGLTSFPMMVETFEGKEMFKVKNANAEWPVYKATYKGTDVALFMMDMGAAGAGGMLEEMYALGIEMVVIFGSCGVLDKNIHECAIIIPNAAVRDEGLSYHYLPASDEIEVNTEFIDTFKSILDEVKYPYIVGKTWTTDAFYRETRTKVKKRVEAGCLCVEMECSAMAAVAKFRDKGIFQFLYTADCLDGEQWDARCLDESTKVDEKSFFAHLAMEMAVRASK